MAKKQNKKHYLIKKDNMVQVLSLNIKEVRCSNLPFEIICCNKNLNLLEDIARQINNKEFTVKLQQHIFDSKSKSSLYDQKNASAKQHEMLPEALAAITVPSRKKSSEIPYKSNSEKIQTIKRNIFQANCEEGDPLEQDLNDWCPENTFENISSASAKRNIFQANCEEGEESDALEQDLSDDDWCPENTFENICPASQSSESDNIQIELEDVDSLDGNEEFPLLIIDNGDVAQQKSYAHKKHCCLFCGELITHLPRHLQRKHKNEERLKEAFAFDSKQDRKKVMENIRKEGDFKYNNSLNDNSEKYIAVKSSTKPGATTTLCICPYCKGYYSKKNLRNHIRLNCNEKRIGVKKYNFSKLKSIMIHSSASSVLTDKILPRLRDLQLVKLIAADATLISYGNRLVQKLYKSSSHHFKYIVEQLRIGAKLLLHVKSINPAIRHISDMIDPAQYPNVVKAIHTFARLKDGQFEAPTRANSACILVLHLAKLVKCEAIIKNNKALATASDEFTYLMQQNQNSDITKLANVNRIGIQRSKVEILPTTKEINNLLSAIESEAGKLCSTLLQKFSPQTFFKLSKYTLAYLMVFNRRRPGDCEKTLVNDYKNLSAISEDYLKSLSDSEKEHAKKFGRFIAQGKLNKKSSNLVIEHIKRAIDLLLLKRDEAGISSENKYLFANPKGKLYPYFKADKSLQSFCDANGFQYTKFLATKLRKHLATSTSNLSDKQQREISEFMGHGIEIHNNIYKQRAVDTDIMLLGKVLLGKNDYGKMPHETSTIQEGGSSTFIGNNANSSQSSASHENIETNPVFCITPPPLELLTTEEVKLNSASTLVKKRISNGSTTSSKKSEPSTSHKNVETNPVFCVTPPPFETRTEEVCKSSEYTPVRIRKLNSSSTPEKSTLKNHMVTSPSSNQILRINRKKIWRTPERQVMREAYKDYLEMKTVPSLIECQEIAYQSGILQTRTLPQVRSWINAEISRQTRKVLRGWTTPQKLKCREHFKAYYEKRSKNVYPSISEMEEAISTIPEFRNKTSATLRSHLQHDFVYVK